MKKIVLIGLLGVLVVVVGWRLVTKPGLGRTVGAKPAQTAAEWAAAKGLKVNEKDEHGRTLAHFAAEEGRVDLLEWLKEQGADVNAKGNQDETPMHWAAKGGHINALEWLKKQGADVNAKCDPNIAPMHLAAFGGHVEAMKWLKEQGADIGAEPNKGAPIHAAASGGADRSDEVA